MRRRNDVERKGTNTWSFGIHSPSESSQAMDELALDLKFESISYPDYNFQRFSK